MKKNQTSRQKLNLSRETLRHLQARQLMQAVGGTTDVTCPITYCYPCQPSFQGDTCPTTP
jgi:hypothetical protein